MLITEAFRILYPAGSGEPNCDELYAWRVEDALAGWLVMLN